ELTGVPGEYGVETAFPEPGTYLLFDEFMRTGGQAVVKRDTLVVGASSATSTPAAVLAEDLTPKQDGQTRVTLQDAEVLRVGQPARLLFHLEDASTGAPIRDLAPYLGAPAHAIILNEAASTFVHAHGEPVGAAGHSMLGMGQPPADTSGHAHGGEAAYGPDIAVEPTFAASGMYKLWGQFQAHDGHVIT